MTPLMLVPNEVKVAIRASVINAAAIAYSESSKPLSSLRNAFIMLRFPFGERGGARFALVRPGAPSVFACSFLLDVAGQVRDHALDAGAQGCEYTNDCQCDQSGGYRVFRKFQ